MNDDEIDSFLKEKTIKFDTMCCKVAAARVHGGIASKLRGRWANKQTFSAGEFWPILLSIYHTR